jgi:hypothetical protein
LALESAGLVLRLSQIPNPGRGINPNVELLLGDSKEIPERSAQRGDLSASSLSGEAPIFAAKEIACRTREAKSDSLEVAPDALESDKGDFGNDSLWAELKSRNRLGVP